MYQNKKTLFFIPCVTLLLDQQHTETMNNTQCPLYYTENKRTGGTLRIMPNIKENGRYLLEHQRCGSIPQPIGQLAPPKKPPPSNQRPPSVARTRHPSLSLSHRFPYAPTSYQHRVPLRIDRDLVTPVVISSRPLPCCNEKCNCNYVTVLGEDLKVKAHQ